MLSQIARTELELLRSSDSDSNKSEVAMRQAAIQSTKEDFDHSSMDKDMRAIVNLLERGWFQRIWVSE
jgi:hypothetical protein